MIRETTRSLLEAIALDTWPTLAAQVDFGVTSQRHYEALYYAVRAGEISAEALDRALGDGPALTALVAGARSNPHKDLRFATAWDELRR